MASIPAEETTTTIQGHPGTIRITTLIVTTWKRGIRLGKKNFLAWAQNKNKRQNSPQTKTTKYTAFYYPDF